MDGRGIKDLHKYGEEMSKNSSIPSQEQRKQVSWMPEWLGRGEREGDKGRKAFCPGWRHEPGQKGGLLSRLVVPTGTKGYAGLLSRLEPPTGTKGSHFVPVGVSNQDKRPPSPPLARLAVGPGTKATYCPGPKGNRDKWPGTKACPVVVIILTIIVLVKF